MPITFTVNVSQTSNIMLKHCEGKLFITSIDPDCLMTMPVAFENNENLMVRKGKAVKVEPQEALQIIKETGSKYLFSKTMADGSFATTV
jgi:hypothetical protein